MGVSKVEANGKVLIDLTNDTVGTENLLEGYIAHDKTGALVHGGLKITDSGEFVPASDSTSAIIETSLNSIGNETNCIFSILTEPTSNDYTVFNYIYIKTNTVTANIESFSKGHKFLGTNYGVGNSTPKINNGIFTIDGIESAKWKAGTKYKWAVAIILWGV